MATAPLIGPPIVGMETDPFEELDRGQRRAIQRAVQARAAGDMTAYRSAMAEVDRISDQRMSLRDENRRAFA